MEKEQRYVFNAVLFNILCRCMGICCSSYRSIVMGKEFVGGLMVATCFYMIVAIIILIVIGEI